MHLTLPDPTVPKVLIGPLVVGSTQQTVDKKLVDKYQVLALSPVEVLYCSDLVKDVFHWEFSSELLEQEIPKHVLTCAKLKLDAATSCTV